MKFAIGYNIDVGNFIADQIPETELADFGNYTTLGIIRNDKLVCGVLYSNWRPEIDIWMTIGAIDPKWCNRTSLREIFNYPFEELGLRRVTALIAKKNKRSRRLVEGVGFKYEGNARNYMKNGDDCIIYGMLKKECKWIKQ